MADQLSALSCSEFAERLASAEPVPGGGGAAALIASLAASLGAMAANLSLGKKKLLSFEADHRRIIDDCDRLRLRFLALIEEDAAAFEPLSRIYAADKNSPGYEAQLRAALLSAAAAPFAMMRCCAELTALLEELREKCSALLLSDVGCAALAARSALEFRGGRCSAGELRPSRTGRRGCGDAHAENPEKLSFCRASLFSSPVFEQSCQFCRSPDRMKLLFSSIDFLLFFC